jgi:hypothetical protein
MSIEVQVQIARDQAAQKVATQTPNLQNLLRKPTTTAQSASSSAIAPAWRNCRTTPTT